MNKLLTPPRTSERRSKRKLDLDLEPPQTPTAQRIRYKLPCRSSTRSTPLLRSNRRNAKVSDRGQENSFRLSYEHFEIVGRDFEKEYIQRWLSRRISAHTNKTEELRLELCKSTGKIPTDLCLDSTPDQLPGLLDDLEPSSLDQLSSDGPRSSEIDLPTFTASQDASNIMPLTLILTGPPGTGKTSTLLNELQSFRKNNSKKNLSIQTVFMNCSQKQTNWSLFSQIIYEWTGESISCSFKAWNALQAKLLNLKNPVFLVLDELDFLLHSKTSHSDMYRLLEYFTHLSSNVDIIASQNTPLLFGIANQISFRERFLSRIEPELIPQITFKPYTASQIYEILRSRLQINSNKTENKENQDNTKALLPISDAALQLISRKISASSGDLRKALEICRIAIESRERSSIEDGEPNAPVTIGEISKFIHQISTASSPRFRLKDLSLQQKAVLATMCVPSMLNESVYNVKALYQLYTNISDLDILPLSQFTDIIDSLETRGIIQICTNEKSLQFSATSKNYKGAATSSPTSKITLAVAKIDVLTCIGSIGILTQFVKKCEKQCEAQNAKKVDTEKKSKADLLPLAEFIK